jgi:hypothetical protein
VVHYDDENLTRDDDDDDDDDENDDDESALFFSPLLLFFGKFALRGGERVLAFDDIIGCVFNGPGVLLRRRLRNLRGGCSLRRRRGESTHHGVQRVRQHERGQDNVEPSRREHID